MAQLFKGRMAAKIEGEFVVFLIGARINNLLAVNKWLPVARAMQGMMAELAKHKHLGLLHMENAFLGRTTLSVQYWRSPEQLHAYANMKDGLHLPAWKAFYRAAAGNTAVGIFHETYVIRNNSHECIYANMPAFGLGAAGELVPAEGRMNTMRSRLGEEE